MCIIVPFIQTVFTHLLDFEFLMNMFLSFLSDWGKTTCDFMSYPILKVLDYDTYVINKNRKEVIECHTRPKRFIPSANSVVIDNPLPVHPTVLDDSLQLVSQDNVSTGHQLQDTSLLLDKAKSPR